MCQFCFRVFKNTVSLINAGLVLFMKAGLIYEAISFLKDLLACLSEMIKDNT